MSSNIAGFQNVSRELMELILKVKSKRYESHTQLTFVSEINSVRTDYVSHQLYCSEDLYKDTQKIQDTLHEMGIKVSMDWGTHLFNLPSN